MTGSIKTYAIVGFVEEEDSIEVIPTSWIISSLETKYPNVYSITTIYKYVQECKPPNENWKTIQIKIFGYSNSFKSARRKANLIQQTLNASSDLSESDDEKIRAKKRKKSHNRRSNIAYSSDIETSENEGKSLKRKRPKNKVLPLLLSHIETLENGLCAVQNERTFNRKNSLSPKLNSNQEAILTSQNDSINSIENEQNSQETDNILTNVSKKQLSQTQNQNKDNYIQATKFDQFFKYLELIHEQINAINSKFEIIESQIEGLQIPSETDDVFSVTDIPVYNEDFGLPLNTEEELKELNEKLRLNKDFSRSLIHYLCNVTIGRNARSFVLNVVKRLMTQEVALQFSIYGKKGKKALSIYSETVNVIIAAARLKFKDVEKEKIFDFLGRALSGASDWNGRRIRRSDILLFNI